MKFDTHYNKHYDYNYKVLYLSPKIIIQYISAITKLTRLQLLNTIDKNKVLELQNASVFNIPIGT